MSTYNVEPDELRGSAGDLRTAASSARGADASDAISTLGGALPGSSTASAQVYAQIEKVTGIEKAGQDIDTDAATQQFSIDAAGTVTDIAPPETFDNNLLALDSILSTGDGTREHAWSVLRISDEYDVLRSQRRVSSVQTLIVDGDRSLDRHVCDDGTEAWFDVTGLVSTARRA